MLRVIEYFASHSSSLKVIRNDTLESVGVARTCKYFIVNCNYVAIFNRFSDIQR